MAEAVVSMVTERIGNLLIEEAKFIHGVRDQVRDIRDELWWMQCFLRDADARQSEDHRVRTWIREIKEIAYDAGDVLESYLLRVESRKGGSILNVLKRYTCFLNECIVRHNIGSNIQDIKTRISYLTTRLHTYGMISSLSKDPEGSNRRQSQSSSSYLHAYEDDFEWLEDDLKKMVEVLVNDDKDGNTCYQVVAICSSSGMGKSTLARKVYKHDEVKRHFKAAAWVSITQNWQLKEVFQQILSKLIPDENEKEKDQIFKSANDDNLREKLICEQKNKKCLIVLDDIRDKETWTSLASAFPDHKTMKGKLLLTTRNKDVASHVNPSAFVHELRPLSTDEGWKLLKKIALPTGDRSGRKEVKEKEKLGREMINHCKGLPLAVIVLGRILATKQNFVEWKRVHQSIDSYLRSGEGIGEDGVGLSKILGSSYNDLPYQLKPCFLYLGKFQEDEDIEAERLYQLWMAESMILSEDRREGETMMDVAERYLGELAQRCMVHVQLEENKYGLNIGKFNSCRLHDLMRDLCLSKAKEEDFFNTFNFQHENGSELVESSSFANKTRRVVIYFEDEKTDSGKFSLSKETSQRLRSLLFFADEYREYCGMPSMVRSSLSDFKMLRVLAIEGFCPTRPKSGIFKLANFNCDNLALLKAIGKLIHLIFLSFKDSEFFMFPSSINNLQHLQTLDLRGTFRFYPKCSASVLRKMRRLQHLYLPADYGDSDRRKMRRLQHLYLPCYPYCDSDSYSDDMVQVFKPSKLQLDSLSNLETLENYIPKWCDGKGLCKLINLQKLEAMLYDLEEVEQSIDYLSSTAAKHMRHSYVCIRSLDFDAAKGHAILKKILSCDHLHRLDLGGGICKNLPGCDEDFNFSRSLTIICLYDFPLKEDPMPTLERLPNLQSLTLWNAFGGEEMVCADKGFPQLKSLKLSFLESFNNWRVEKGAMPELSKLKFSYCKSLKAIPDGLRFITTLRKLVIDEMDEEFRRKVQVVDGKRREDSNIIPRETSIIYR